MKVKYFFVSILFVMLIISISQIFSIYPFAENIFKVYKSGYFNELDKQFNVIADSFVQIKYYNKPTYSWLYLNKIEKKYNISIKVYDKTGNRVITPGEKQKNDDSKVLSVINSSEVAEHSEIIDGKYYKILPLKANAECVFCHKSVKKNKIVGVLTFNSPYNTKIYYSSERIIIFVVLSIIIAIILFYTIKWDPEKNIKELFDKS